MTILEEADKLIHGERREAYGEAARSFERIAVMWSQLLSHPVTGPDVAIMMIAFKLCREANQHKRDNLVDVCGYAALAQDIHDAQAKEAS